MYVVVILQYNVCSKYHVFFAPMDTGVPFIEYLYKAALSHKQLASAETSPCS